MTNNDIIVGAGPAGHTAAYELLDKRNGIISELVKNDSFNRFWLIVWSVVIVILFVAFKYYYPFAGFINGDSYTYLDAAYHNFTVNTYPTGYSKFLRLISIFSNADCTLVFIQYIMLEASLVFFLYTAFHYYNPAKWVKISVMFFLIPNPLLLYLANYVSSDALFISLSLIWFTLLLWLLQRPSWNILLLHGIVIFLAFTVRYNAMYYPVISLVAFALSGKKLVFKITGLALAVLLIAGYVLNMTDAYARVTGTRQFTPFSGWQLANNAMYAYRYIDKKDVKPVPEKFRKLDVNVRTYFDTTRDLKKYPYEKLLANTIYMWTPKTPLRTYMAAVSQHDTAAGGLRKWARVGPLYAEYGTFIIENYPGVFFRYYIVPNTLKYFAPPVEFLQTYSTGVDSVAPVARDWFGYKSRKITTRFPDFKVRVLDYFPAVSGIFNVLFITTLLAYRWLALNKAKENTDLNKALLLAFTFWLVNFVFSVFAAPVALRFQIFPMVVSILFSLIMLHGIWEAATSDYFKNRQIITG